MHMDPGIDQPRYRQLAMSLAERICKGEYPLGDLIPGEEQLCREFGLSRYTVRSALRQLQDAGLIQRRNGVGSQVIARAPTRAFAHTIGSIEEVQQYALNTRLTVHEAVPVVADELLARELGCALGQAFLRIVALRVEDPEARDSARLGVAIAWTRIHVVAHYAAIADELGTMTDAIGTRIEQRFGERISAIEQTIRALSLGEREAEMLGVEPGSAGMQVDRRYLGRDGRPFEYVTSIHPAERFSISMRLERSGSV